MRYTIFLLLFHLATDPAHAQQQKPATNSQSTLKDGIWFSASGNIFCIRSVNREIYWLGMNKEDSSGATGRQWCHVGHGRIKNNLIILNWADMPYGKDRLHGRIVIRILSPAHLKIIDDGGIFGKSDFYWKMSQMQQ